MKSRAIPRLAERKLWKKLKDETSSIAWTRLENWALFGTPDLLGYSSNGNFFTVELKSTSPTKPYLVHFSAHQISIHIKHKKNTYILVACALDQLVRLYPGSRILELVDSGVKLDPLACGLKSCVSVLEGL